MRSYSVKENPIGSAVSVILLVQTNRQTKFLYYKDILKSIKNSINIFKNYLIQDA